MQFSYLPSHSYLIVYFSNSSQGLYFEYIYTNVSYLHWMDELVETGDVQQIESDELDDLADGMGTILLDIQELIARRYQVEIIEKCFIQNSIIFLGTGTGKTFIAVEVIKRFKSQILGEFWKETQTDSKIENSVTKERSEFKRTFFVCNMVPLAIQQATYITDNLGEKFSVRRVIGADIDDKWDNEHWHTELQKYHVFVVTGEILRKLLVKVIIRMKDINLLIFDEAHHVSKDDIYKQIMDCYHLERRQDTSVHTRIIGLTASLLNEKNMDRKLEEKLERLASIYNSNIITAKDFVEVDEHCARPDFSTVCYTEHVLDEKHLMLIVLLEDFSTFIEKTGGDKWKAVANTNASSKLTASITNHVYQQDQNFEIKSLQCVKRLGKKLQVVVEQLGPWIGYTFAVDLKNKLTAYYKEIEMDHLQAAVSNLISIISVYISSWKAEPELHEISDKVRVFYNEIKLSSEMRNFCGIAFIKDRVVAYMLNKHLTKLASTDSKLSHIKSTHFTGQSPSALFPEVFFSCTSQIELLEKFRKGKLNFLIATEVLLEGFNIPQCNLVITFDKIDHFRYFTQSRGRARAKGGQYKYLVPVENKEVAHLELERYDNFELDLRKFVHNKFVYTEKEYVEPKNIPPPLTTSTGASISYEQAVSCVYQYCQNLVDGENLDRFTMWVPVFRIFRREVAGGNDMFFCVISMPKCCYALTETVTSDEWVESKRAAQRRAALNVCKKLYQLNEIDDQLQPKYRIVKLFKEKQKYVAPERLGIRGKKAYSINIPNSVQKLSIKPHMGSPRAYFLYPLHIKRREGSSISIAILLSNRLSVLPPSFKLVHAKDSLDVVEVEMGGPEQVELAFNTFTLLLRCYEILIQSIIPTETTFLEFKPTNGIKQYIVVPVTCHTGLQNNIDYKRIREIISTAPSDKHNCIEVNLEPQSYIGMRVKKNYPNCMDISSFKIIDAGRDISINSPFPDLTKADTFKDYFHIKYGFELTVEDQPYIKVEQYKFLVPNYTRKARNEQSRLEGSREKKTIILFPEMVEELLLFRNLTPDILLLPSMLHAIESYLMVIEFRKRLYPDTDTHFLLLDQLYSALTLRRCQEELDLERNEFLGDTCLKFLICTSLYCSSPTASQALLTLRKSICVSNKQLVEIAVKDELNLPSYMRGHEFMPKHHWLPPCVVPIQETRSVFTQAIAEVTDMDVDNSIKKTASADANRDTELTDMEVDSDVNKVAAMNLTPDATQLGSKMDIDKKTESNKSKEETLTSKPGSSYLRQSLANKSIADSFESIIGSILVCGGLLAALAFMHKYGRNELFITIEGSPLSLTIPTGVIVELDQVNDPFYLFLKNGEYLKQIFSFSVPGIEWNLEQMGFYENNHQKDIIRLARDKLKLSSPLTPSHESILLEALTHDSYNLGTISLTRSYQRMEFLGDAVLDYLVTTYIMCVAPQDFQPKDLHIVRACVVSNRNFARLAVESNIYVDMVYSNQHLGKEIREFVEYIKHHRNNSNQNESFFKKELDYLLQQKRKKFMPTSDATEKKECSLAKAPKALGDVFESVACAIFLIADFHLEVVWKSLGEMLQSSVYEFLKVYKLTKFKNKQN